MLKEMYGIDISSITLPVVVTFIAFLVRLSSKRQYYGLLFLLLDIVVVVFTGIMIFFLVHDYDLSRGTRWFIVAIGSIVGPDIVTGILQTGSMFSRAPVTFTLRIYRTIINKPLTSEEIKELMQWEKEMRRNNDKDDKT